MNNLHDITTQLSEVFGIDSSTQTDNAQLLVELTAQLLERVVTTSFSYLSSDDQQILDGMMDAAASPDDVLNFLAERVSELSNIVTAVVAAMRNEADEILAIANGDADGAMHSTTTSLEVAPAELDSPAL
jgi:hypothetical protein